MHASCILFIINKMFYKVNWRISRYQLYLRRSKLYYFLYLQVDSLVQLRVIRAYLQAIMPLVQVDLPELVMDPKVWAQL